MFELIHASEARLNNERIENIVIGDQWHHGTSTNLIKFIICSSLKTVEEFEEEVAHEQSGTQWVMP